MSQGVSVRHSLRNVIASAAQEKSRSSELSHKSVMMDIHMEDNKIYRNKGKTHECEICKKICKDAHDLRKHVRTHTGEKPFKCQVCQQRFFQSSSQKIHEKTHQR